MSRIPANAMPFLRDRYFAPSVLAPFADDLARRLCRLSVGPLLEVAGDTGVLTQAIASAVSAGLTIIATDPTADLVAYASGKPGMARVAWQQADPEALPFQDASFGIVTCQFSLATIPHRLSAFREARRVIKQGGRFVFSVLGTIHHNPIADCLQTALDRLFPDQPPRFLANGLHGYANNAAIDDDLTAAGFTDAVYTTVELPFAAASAQDIALGYCLGTPLRSELEARMPVDTEPAVQAATLALAGRFGTGPVNATMRAQVISAAG
ncbi:MAG TPA: methyltransferase domain-containing protein [Rhodopila sp.]